MYLVLFFYIYSSHMMSGLDAGVLQPGRWTLSAVLKLLPLLRHARGLMLFLMSGLNCVTKMTSDD